MRAWLNHHRHSLTLALARLALSPVAAALNILVIGIALSLPVGLYVALGNLERLAGQAPKDPEITLFLKQDVSETAGRALSDALSRDPAVAHARFISREAGLKDLEQGGLGDLLAGLDDNPLPHVVVLLPRDIDAAAIEALGQRVAKSPGVDQVSVDSDWAKRLTALLRFGGSVVWLLAGVLSMAMAAITGNTIRLQIYALRDEIEVSRLIGASDRFIRRPFLYYGALQGLLGGIAGWAMVTGAKLGLGGHVDRLAAAYGTQFNLAGLTPLESLFILLASAALGWLGAYLAVGHALRQIDR